MAARDIENLTTLRAFYVERRRHHAAIAASDARQGISGQNNDKVESLQARIEVIDRAIVDERSLELEELNSEITSDWTAGPRERNDIV